MAGRLKDYIYETDEGRLYAVRLDESNSQIAALGRVPYTNQTDPKAPMLPLTRPPVGLRLRSISAINPTTGNRREFTCGTPRCTAYAGQVTTIALTDYNDRIDKDYIIEKRTEERQNYPPKRI